VDISDRKRTEDALREGEQRFRAMVDRALAHASGRRDAESVPDRNARGAGSDFAIEKRYMRKDGDAVNVTERVSGSP
jgi:PAS domain-containing protein